MVARTVSGIPTSSRINVRDILVNLHWLPCKERIIFKALCLVYNAVILHAPKYLSDMFRRRSHRGRKHNPQDILLVVPFTSHKTFADRSLSVAGAQLWNSLPMEIRLSPSIGAFKQSLKTHLFKHSLLTTTFH